MEKVFLPDSYGYRPGKSALDAVGVTRERCWKYDWVLEFDIKGLFDNIEHRLLLKFPPDAPRAHQVIFQSGLSTGLRSVVLAIPGDC